MDLERPPESPPRPGIHLGRDFWPEITWGLREAKEKHIRVVPWGVAPERNDVVNDPLGRKNAKRTTRY